MTFDPCVRPGKKIRSLHQERAISALALKERTQDLSLCRLSGAHNPESL
jgi:hypothetical protein